MHIAQGLMKTTNVNKLTSSGIHFTFLVADWFAQLNNKFKGDLSKIRKVGQYFLEIWKACGMNLEHVSFVWSSEEVNKRPDEYWQMVMDIARKNSVARVKRCGQIMGRSGDADSAQNESLLRSIFRSREADAALNEDEFVRKHLPSARSDNQPVAQLLYPLMQCADVFFLRSSICQLGLDQLKVNVLAREYCDQLKGEKKRLRKPIVLSHPMLMGLKQGQAKMSKSNPDSAIFMEDSEAEVERKMKRAYCKPGDVEENPVLDYLDKVVFPWYGCNSDFLFVVTIIFCL
ncbi:hypothetical protein MHBO_004068 [Bonamia ostreae]|uniref:tyrosine--tRNA ligase n=1 Tax=Bonamia ostreae TaxID=126728 RepID=A0ABV2AT28_9EUKA